MRQRSPPRRRKHLIYIKFVSPLPGFQLKEWGALFELPERRSAAYSRLVVRAEDDYHSPIGRESAAPPLVAAPSANSNRFLRGRE